MNSFIWNIGYPLKELVTAQLHPDGSFIVTGAGDTEKYVTWEQIPWKEHRTEIRKVIFKENVQPTSISSWFYGCENLKTVENFPNSIKNMSIAFCGCVQLTALPELPAALTDLDEAFIDCRSLTSFPVIPENVIYTCDTFVNCEKLTGRMLLKARLQQHAFMFQDACTNAEAPLIIDYQKGLEAVADAIIATGTAASHITKGRAL